MSLPSPSLSLLQHSSIFTSLDTISQPAVSSISQSISQPTHHHHHHQPQLTHHLHSLSDLAIHLLKQGPNKILRTPRRVRIVFNQAVIVDTTSAVLVWEHDYYPHFYVPASEIKNATLRDSQPVKGEADATARVAVAELTVAERAGIPAKTTNRVLRFDSSWGDLAGLVRVEFAAAGKSNRYSIHSSKPSIC